MSSLSITIPNLNPTSAAIDPLYRALEGLDTNNASLFISAWTHSTPPTLTMSPSSPPITGLDAIRAAVFDALLPITTLHTTSNIRIEMLDEASTKARLTAYGVNHHYRDEGEAMDPAKEGLVSGNRYRIEVVQEEEGRVWRIREWEFRHLWLRGDAEVLSGEGGNA